jgi:translation elongation factor aEF-1 beta
MGKVAATYRILPEGTEIDLKSLEDSVRRVLGSKLVKIETQPVAFGLKALIATAVFNDASGEGEAVESNLGSLPGVSSVEVMEMGLI